MQSIDFAERGAGHRGVLSIAKVWRERGESFALCLIVLTEGSTYRKAGALAVIRADGIRCGVISGGCLESALDTGALEVLHARKSRVVVFDTQGDDDSVFGSGSGCRGRMTVLIVPIGPIESIVRAADAVFDALIHADACHLPLKLALVIEGPAQGSNDVQGMDVAHGLGWCGEQQFAMGVASPVLGALRGAAIGEHRVTLSTGERRVAVFAVMPSPRVLIMGAGPEAPALIRMANQLGWIMTVIDHRQSALDALSSIADHLVLGWPNVGLAKLGGEVFDACVIMTHSAAKDLEALNAVALRAEPYVGLLGPPARRDELLVQMDPARKAALLGRLHAPVGLNLGGEGPEPLALSIIAELQQGVAIPRQMSYI